MRSTTVAPKLTTRSSSALGAGRTRGAGPRDRAGVVGRAATHDLPQAGHEAGRATPRRGRQRREHRQRDGGGARHRRAAGPPGPRPAPRQGDRMAAGAAGRLRAGGSPGDRALPGRPCSAHSGHRWGGGRCPARPAGVGRDGDCAALRHRRVRRAR